MSTRRDWLRQALGTSVGIIAAPAWALAELERDATLAGAILSSTRDFVRRGYLMVEGRNQAGKWMQEVLPIPRLGFVHGLGSFSGIDKIWVEDPERSVDAHRVVQAGVSKRGEIILASGNSLPPESVSHVFSFDPTFRAVV